MSGQRAVFDKKRYAREWARRKRAAKLAATNASATVCQHRRGRHGVCGGVLETTTDGRGGTVTTCPLCARRLRGICRDCGQPVEGRVGSAVRCAFHKAEERRATGERYAIRHPVERRRASLANYRGNPVRRKRKNEYKKLWRAANPEKVKAYKRRESLTPNAKRCAYHAARRARERAELAARELARYHGTTELRTCVTPGCQIVVTHRKKKCSKCRERARLVALATLAPTQGRGRRVDLERSA